MKIEKIYQTTVNISPKEMEQDLNKVCMEKIKDRFEGKCHFSTYILKIIEIVQRSKCSILKDSLYAIGQVHIQFKAQAVVYEKDEVVFAKVIHPVFNGYIYCVSKYSNISIKLHKGLINMRIKTDQILPVKISKSEYNNGQDKIQSLGNIFNLQNPRFTKNLYNISLDNLNSKSKNMIIFAIEQVKKEELKKKKYPATQWKFFESLLDINEKDKNTMALINLMKQSKQDLIESEQQKLQKIGINKPSNMEVMIQLFEKLLKQKGKGDNNMYVTRSLGLNKASNKCEVYNIPENKKEILLNDGLIISKQSAEVVMVPFLNEYRNQLKIIRKMCKNYPTSTSIKEHSEIWQIIYVAKATLSYKFSL